MTFSKSDASHSDFDYLKFVLQLNGKFSTLFARSSKSVFLDVINPFVYSGSIPWYDWLKKILEQKQALLPKKTVLKDKDRNQLTWTFADKETHTPRAHYRSSSPFKNDSNNLFGNQESSDTDNKLKIIGTNEESTDDDHADSYSDIDWLQCEDI